MKKVELEVLYQLNTARLEMTSDPRTADLRIGFAHWLVFEFADDMGAFVDVKAEYAKFLEYESEKVGA